MGATDLARTIEAVRGAVQTDREMETMRRVYASDRWFTFPRFHKTAELLRDEMTSRGLKNVELVEAPADGSTQVGFWTMPMAWDVRSARLEILDDSIAADQRVLADYATVPASLGMWSGPTAPGGVVTEIVPEKQDVRGKLALTEENPANSKWELVKAGALGAINTFTENPALANGRQWINAWGDSGWAYTKRSPPLLCFSISPEQTRLLHRLLAHGPVRVRATVDSRYYSGNYPYVTAVVPGAGPEEVLTLGHAFEQGAQDNATGVAATLEAVTLLRELIDKNSLPRPRRGIRILSMGEMYGSMHYVASNPERIRRTIAAICVDTPAAFYDLAGTEYTFYMNPHVAKDFTDALILKIAADYFPSVHRPWHEKPFATGTDTYMAEPMVGIPTVWGYSGSGVETHHNSEDTPDRVDPRSLRDITIVTAAYLYYIANESAPEAAWLAQLSETRAYTQILQAPPEREAIDYSVDRESQSVLSVLRLAAPEQRDKLRRDLQPALDRLRAFGDMQVARIPQLQQTRPQPNSAAEQIVVKRKRFGTNSGRALSISSTYFRFLRKRGYVDFAKGE